MTKNDDDKQVYIVIPVYNEASVIGSVIIDIKKYFSNIVCVNDGSRDNSAAVIKQSGATLLSHAVNLGAGAATQTGIDYALSDPQAKYFITLDADGQHEVEGAKRMLAYLKQYNLDVVFGSRFLGEIENISAVKKTFLKVAGRFSHNTSGVKLSDPHIGLRVFNRKFAEALKITMPGFAHASEVVHRIGEGQFKYGEVPVKVTYSDYSKAKGQSMLNAINITFDLLFHRVTKK